MRSVFRPRTATVSLVAVTIVGLGWSLFGLGCPPPPTPPGLGGGERPIPEETEITILEPTASRTVTVGDAVSLSYQISSAPEILSVSAFLQRREPDPINAALKTNLSTTGQIVALSTAGLAPGEYLPTVSIRSGDDRKQASATTADGEIVVIRVQGEGTIVFSAPSTSGPFAIGSVVPIKFSLTQSPAMASFRIFHDSDGLANGNETLIDLGRGDHADTEWDTGGLLPGRYFIGVTIEATGLSMTEFVTDSAGFLLPIILDESPAIVVTAPAVNRIVTTDSDEQVLVSFSAQDRDTSATIDIFVDLDSDFSNGIFRKLNKTGLEINTTNFALRPSELEPNTYFIGASVNPSDLVSSPVAAYAPGKIEIITGDRPSIVLTCVVPPGEICPKCPPSPPTIKPGAALRNLSLNIAEGLGLTWRAFDANSTELDMAVYLDPDRFPLSGNELLIDSRHVTQPNLFLPDENEVCFEARIGPGQAI